MEELFYIPSAERYHLSNISSVILHPTPNQKPQVCAGYSGLIADCPTFPPVSTTDGLIAATALEHDLVVVTRNVKDFARLGVAILNPSEEGLPDRPAT